MVTPHMGHVWYTSLQSSHTHGIHASGLQVQLECRLIDLVVIYMNAQEVYCRCYCANQQMRKKMTATQIHAQVPISYCTFVVTTCKFNKYL